MTPNEPTLTAEELDRLEKSILPGDAMYTSIKKEYLYTLIRVARRALSAEKSHLGFHVPLAEYERLKSQLATLRAERDGIVDKCAFIAETQVSTNSSTFYADGWSDSARAIAKSIRAIPATGEK